jgi:hypothetical protein
MFFMGVSEDISKQSLARLRRFRLDVLPKCNYTISMNFEWENENV